MPKRLTQLVKTYPYPKQASPMDHHFLPRPKFTTRRQTALFVRVSSGWKEQMAYRNDPIQLLKDALRADVDKASSPSELLGVWEELKAHANQGTAAEEGSPAPATLTLSALLTEEAIRLLTSANAEAFPSSPQPVALSQTSLLEGVSGHAQGSSTSGTSRAPSDWDGFTSAGFEFMGGLNLAGGLQDYTSPPTSPGKSKGRSLERGRRGSPDNNKSTLHDEYDDAGIPFAAAAAAAKPSIASETIASTLLLDEALIDGWADTLADPAVSSAWPPFVLYHLRAPLADPTPTTTTARGSDDPEAQARAPGTIDWLVVETHAPAPPPPSPRRDKDRDKDKEKNKDRRSSSRPRFAGFFASATSVVTTKDKDKDKDKDKEKDKEGKKKEKDSGSAPARRSSLGILRG